ncbi:MAG TPA: VWA domain-containing protein [Acidobacteria bacterium]|nr:VWA domain-containing protein [Acidobacteriota bacterium]
MLGLSFLVPAFLVGGLAALVPLILHLRRRERLPRLPFSDIRFLRDVPVEQARRRRLREWLLLALRVAALFLLALAFARPFLNDTDAAALASQSATVVLIDTSFSMSAPAQLAAARGLALEAIDAAPDGHLVGVVAFDTRTRVVAELGERPAARSAIEAVSPGPRGTRYADGLAAAGAMIGTRDGRIVVVTDLQAGGWNAGDGLVPPGVDVSIRDAGRPDGNLAIVAVESEPTQTLAVLFRAGTVSDDTIVSLRVDDELLAEVAVTAEPGHTTVRLPVLPEAGVATVSVNDGVGYGVDDRRYRLLDPPAPTPVLIVVGGGGGDDGDAARDTDAVFYLQRALAPGESAGPFLPEVVRAEAYGAPTNIALGPRTGAVVLVGGRGLGRRGRERLATFVRDGGGLFVVGGNAADLGGLDSLDSLFGGEPELGLGASLTHPEPVGLMSQDPRHPIMGGLGGLAGALGQTRFSQTRPLRAGDGTVLARFSDGNPALVEHTVGAGRLLIFGAGLGADGSDFPRRATFVPFLHETLTYLSATDTRSREFIVGDSPVGTVARTEAPGVVEAGDGRRVVVNVDPRESDPTAVTPEQFAASVGTLSRAAERQERDAAGGRESGQQLWRVLLMLMIVVLVAEGLLGRRMA